MGCGVCESNIKHENLTPKISSNSGTLQANDKPIITHTCNYTIPAKKPPINLITKLIKNKRRKFIIVRRERSKSEMQRITELSNEDSESSSEVRDPKKVLLDFGYIFKAEESEEKETVNIVKKLAIPDKNDL